MVLTRHGATVVPVFLQHETERLVADESESLVAVGP